MKFFTFGKSKSAKRPDAKLTKSVPLNVSGSLPVKMAVAMYSIVKLGARMVVSACKKIAHVPVFLYRSVIGFTRKSYYYISRFLRSVVSKIAAVCLTIVRFPVAVFKRGYVFLKNAVLRVYSIVKSGAKMAVSACKKVAHVPVFLYRSVVGFARKSYYYISRFLRSVVSKAAAVCLSVVRFPVAVFKRGYVFLKNAVLRVYSIVKSGARMVVSVQESSACAGVFVQISRRICKEELFTDFSIFEVCSIQNSGGMLNSCEVSSCCV